MKALRRSRMFSEAGIISRFYIKRFDLDPGCVPRESVSALKAWKAMYLWLNGQFVGYAEDSFTPSEFDLTPFIRERAMYWRYTGA